MPRTSSFFTSLAGIGGRLRNAARSGSRLTVAEYEEEYEEEEADEGTTEGRTSPRVAGWVLLAAVVFLGAALLSMWRVLPAPGGLLTGLAPGTPFQAVDRADQMVVLSTVVGNARRLIENPAALRDEGQCYPLPRAYTLGEHMFGEGLMAAPLLAATDDPILTYNGVLLLRLWLPAMTMFVFVWHVTRSGWAALAAGFLFGLNHYRLVDPVHPFVHADMWAPLALLCIHRLFEGANVGAVVGLAIAVSLTVLESIYPILSVAITLAVYTLWLAARSPSRLRHVAPRIAIALVPPLAVTAWALGPYLEMSEIWGVAKGVSALAVFGHARDFLPRGEYFPGATLCGLAFVGLADRLRRADAEHGGDPRLPLLASGFLCFWSAIYYLPIPPLDLKLGSPVRALAGIVPGLDAARAMVLVKLGLIVGLAVSAGYGARRVAGWVPPRARPWIMAGLAALALIEVHPPAVARLVYGHVPPFQAYPAALVGDGRTLVEGLEGPVLDVPMKPGKLTTQAHYLHWQAYHGEPIAGCYNSHGTAVQHATAEIAARLPEPGAARALAGLGFRTVVVHREQDDGPTAKRFDDGPHAGLTPIATRGPHTIFTLGTPGPTHASFDALRPAPEAHGEARLDPDDPFIDFPFQAEVGATYIHPAPLRPAPLRLTWTHRDDGTVVTQKLRGLLPLAIAGGGRTERRIPIDLTLKPGRWRVSLALEAQPKRVLSRRAVRIPAGS